MCNKQHSEICICMYFCACVFNIMNVSVTYLKYLKPANILIMRVASSKHALEIYPEMLRVSYSANPFFLKHRS